MQSACLGEDQPGAIFKQTAVTTLESTDLASQFTN